MIVQASVNCFQILGVETSVLLGRSLEEVLAKDTFEALRRQVLPSNLQANKKYLQNARLKGAEATFDALIHRYDDVLIVEFEPAPPEDVTNSGLYTQLSEAIGETQGSSSLLALCENIARHVRQLTGFDRVMIYKFLEDESGSVIAEDRRADLTPYLGLRYPASDIPAQARRLYLLNSLRLKADVNAWPVQLIPSLNPVTRRPLDMSYCVLRSMSPVHVEYLKNMGVSASMSVSVVQDGRLWGLIACHHTQPKIVPHRIRICIDILARVFSDDITAAQANDERLRAARVRHFTDHLATQLRNHSSVRRAMAEAADNVKSAIDAQGIAICIDGAIDLVGQTPPPEAVKPIVEWLNGRQDEYVFSTEKLSTDYPPGRQFAEAASGMLSTRIAVANEDFVLWFRPPSIKVIEWGGNPDKPVEETESSKRISPRLSFERWKQTVGDHSQPWGHFEKEFALALRQILAEALLVQKNGEVTRLNEELKRSNIELAAFASAASHDLQEPVRTVRVYAQLLAERAGTRFDEPTRNLVHVIESGAARMAALISALLDYARLGGASTEARLVDFEDVVKTVRANLAESIRDSGADIHCAPLPSVYADPNQMVQLVQNLVSNSIKYRQPNKKSQIDLAAVRVEGVWRFGVSDNGIGFDPMSAGLIFEPFKRLHGYSIPGAGIGLATCKRIVENHNGRIWAESRGEGHGATVFFTLPAE